MSILFLELLVRAAHADDLCYDLEEVNVQDANGVTLYTSWYDVNNHNQFVGNYCIDPNCVPVGEFGQLIGGAIYDANTGTFETFELPPPYNYVGGVSINDHGVVVGEAVNAGPDVGGFVRTPDGNIFLLPPPKATVTSFFVSGINDAGTIVGWFNDPDEGGKFRSFQYAGGHYTLYDASASTDGSIVLDINDSGDLAGQDFPTGQTSGIGFVDGTHGVAPVASPDAFRTGLWGVSNRGSGQVAVGWAELTEGGAQTGFVYHRGAFTFLDFPGAFDTRFHGTNDAGVVAGTIDAFSYGVIGWPCR
jgi:hypothetical protein